MSSDTLCFTLLVLTSNDEFTATAPAADKVARSLVKMETVFYHYPMTERMGANIHQLFLFSAVGAPNIFVFTDFHYSPLEPPLPDRYKGVSKDLPAAEAHRLFYLNFFGYDRPGRCGHAR